MHIRMYAITHCNIFVVNHKWDIQIIQELKDMTKDLEEQEYLAQVVAKHRQDFPDCDKETMKKL